MWLTLYTSQKFTKAVQQFSSHQSRKKIRAWTLHEDVYTKIHELMLCGKL